MRFWMRSRNKFACWLIRQPSGCILWLYLFTLSGYCFCFPFVQLSFLYFTCDMIKAVIRFNKTFMPLADRLFYDNFLATCCLRSVQNFFVRHGDLS